MSRRSNALTAKSSKMECFPRRVVARTTKARRRVASAKPLPSAASSAAPACPAKVDRRERIQRVKNTITRLYFSAGLWCFWPFEKGGPSSLLLYRSRASCANCSSSFQIVTKVRWTPAASQAISFSARSSRTPHTNVERVTSRPAASIS